MLPFFTIGAIGFAYIVLTSLLGHDHDASGDLSHDMGDADHGDGDSGHLMSIFSPRIIAMFLMGFGGVSGLSRYFNKSYLWSCADGLGVGIALALTMYYILEFFARQQSNSLVETRSLVGSIGTVEVAIDGDQPGEVAVSANERYNTYVARARDGRGIEKGRRVVVVETVGSDLIVEEADQA